MTERLERNALRANLVGRAEDWRWSSLRREAGSREILSDWPLPEPASWRRFVNQPQNEGELAAIRRSVQRGRPYGDDAWTSKTAKDLGLESTLRSRGRPKKQKPDLD